MNDFLSKLPSTNFRVFAGVCLAVVFVIGTMAGSFFWPARVPDSSVIEIMAWTVAGILGLDTLHFVGKRATHKTEKTVEDDDG